MLYCNRWSCETCQPRNRWRVILNADGGKPTAMLTLTVSSRNYDTPDEAARDMLRGWRLMRRRLAREKQIEKVPFIVVFERHESGWPHMHILLRTKFIAHGWLKRVWHEITGSHHVDIRAIRRGRSAASYIAKYIGKDPHSFERCKRWWRSHNYDVPADAEQTEFLPVKKWHRVDLPIGYIIADVQSRGCDVLEVRPGYIRWIEEFEPDPPKWIPRNSECKARLERRRR